MIYLDAAATSYPKPPEVAAAMTRCLADDAGNPGRGSHGLAQRAQAVIDRGRQEVATLINAADASRVAFTLSATDALNMAIKGVLHRAPDRPRPHVITTMLEHNAVRRPLNQLQENATIDLTVLPFDEQGFVTPGAVERAWTDQTRLVVLNHASNVIGTIQDAAAVGVIVRQRGGLLLLDACQTAGAVPIDVEALGVDLLAASGHKALQGPPGTGFLYAGPRVDLDTFRAWREGGTGGDSVQPVQPRGLPMLLEAGTPNTVGIAGLTAAIAARDAPQRARDLQHERTLLQQLRDALADDERFILHGCPDVQRCVPTLSLNVQGYEPQDVGAILDSSFEIAVRCGLHCAPWAHEQLGTPTQQGGGSVRVSVGPGNTADDIDRLIDALHQIADATN